MLYNLFSNILSIYFNKNALIKNYLDYLLLLHCESLKYFYELTNVKIMIMVYLKKNPGFSIAYI